MQLTRTGQKNAINVYGDRTNEQKEKGMICFFFCFFLCALDKMMIRWSCRRLIFYVLLLSIIPIYIYQRSQINEPKRTISTVINSTKVSIAHYTPLYQIRTDSKTKIFNRNLEQICQILDPEDYAHADHVFVSLLDWISLPILTNGSSYRTIHQSQLWLVYSEESPRNSYRLISKQDQEKLDDWFNLTATLKPQSDFPIQYRVCERFI